jgi:hypothetical protein
MLHHTTPHHKHHAEQDGGNSMGRALNSWLSAASWAGVPKLGLYMRIWWYDRSWPESLAPAVEFLHGGGYWLFRRVHTDMIWTIGTNGWSISRMVVVTGSFGGCTQVSARGTNPWILKLWPGNDMTGYVWHDGCVVLALWRCKRDGSSKWELDQTVRWKASSRGLVSLNGQFLLLFALVMKRLPIIFCSGVGCMKRVWCDVWPTWRPLVISRWAAAARRMDKPCTIFYFICFYMAHTREGGMEFIFWENGLDWAIWLH